MEKHRSNYTSLRHRLKQSICSSCCFASRRSHHHPTSHRVFNEVREKCRNALGVVKHKNCSAADFRYDPLSYALNFEDGGCDFDDDAAPLRNFSARLPPSPSVTTAVS